MMVEMVGKEGHGWEFLVLVFIPIIFGASGEY